MNNVISVLRPAPVVKKQTVLVFGCARGGTSMVGGVLRELGVAFPGNPHALKHEADIIDDTTPTEKMWLKIKKYDEKWDMWGFKSPKAIFFIEKFMHVLRNPRVLIVFRSIQDIVNSNAKRSEIDQISLYKETSDVYSKISEVIENSYFPIACLDYRLAVENPFRFVDEIIKYLSLEVAPEARMRAVSFTQLRNYSTIASDNYILASSLKDLVRDDYLDSLKIKSKLYKRSCTNIEQMIKASVEDSEEADRIILHMKNIINHEFDDKKEIELHDLQELNNNSSIEENTEDYNFNIAMKTPSQEESLEQVEIEVEQLSNHLAKLRIAYCSQALRRSIQQKTLEQLVIKVGKRQMR